MNKRAPGFSLISFLVSLTVVTVLFTLTFSSVSFLDRLLVRSELAIVHATCYYARSVAAATNKPCDIVITPATNTYTCDGRVRKLPQSVVFGAGTEVYGPPWQPKNQITNPVTFAQSRIRCTPQGSMTSGTLYIVDANKRYQYALSASVSPISYLRSYRYDNGKWCLLT